MFHIYKTQYDYYRTSNVLGKYFGNEILNINDKINLRSLYKTVTTSIYFLQNNTILILKK